MSVEKIGAGCGGRPRPGAVGDIIGTRIPLESSELASRTCGCEVSEDGFADRQAVGDHPFEDSDRLGEDSTTMRGMDSERGLALQFNRFRNSYVTDGTRRKTTLLQWLRKHVIFVSMRHTESGHRFWGVPPDKVCWSWSSGSSMRVATRHAIHRQVRRHGSKRMEFSWRSESRAQRQHGLRRRSISAGTKGLRTSRKPAVKSPYPKRN